MRHGKPWFVFLIELCYVVGTLKSSTEKCRGMWVLIMIDGKQLLISANIGTTMATI